LYTEYGYAVNVSISPIGSVTSAPATIEALDPIVQPITNADALVAPVTLVTTALPPTGAASATLSAITAQLDNTNNSSGLLPAGANGWLAQSYAALAMFSGTMALQTFLTDPVRPAIAPIEPLDRTHANRAIETSG
jgi:hypothetical protein